MSNTRANVIDALIAERIRAYRKQLRLSQLELAAKLDITFQQVQKYEKGTNRVASGRLFEIAGIFHVPIQALFPEPGDSVERARYQTDEARQISEFAVSAEGWRLCHSFLRVADHQKRKKILALVQEIAGE
ncbi:MAG: helix-turn-helix transcriptional regulator [Alphaproteobacteria bacterium]|nr:helix-turn-helix transcriptional regulator [Alphaproteobacteria bacterium]